VSIVFSSEKPEMIWQATIHHFQNQLTICNLPSAGPASILQGRLPPFMYWLFDHSAACGRNQKTRQRPVVIPAQAGIHALALTSTNHLWIPACAGMTKS